MGRVSFGRCCDGGRLCRPFRASDTGSCHRGQGSPAGGSGSPAEIAGFGDFQKISASVCCS